MIAAFIGKENLNRFKSFLNTSYWFQKENFYYSIGAIFYIAMIYWLSLFLLCRNHFLNPNGGLLWTSKNETEQTSYSIRPGQGNSSIPSIKKLETK